MKNIVTLLHHGEHSNPFMSDVLVLFMILCNDEMK